MPQDSLDFGHENPVIAAYGGGVDSTAMLIEMVARGEHIDHALFADVNAEKPETYDYIEIFGNWLASKGVTLTTVKTETKQFKSFSPYEGLFEMCLTNGTLPSISFGRHSCSQRWKVVAQDKWTKTWDKAVEAWSSGAKVTRLIGYDNGPQDSKRYAHREGHVSDLYDYRYPLREWGWDREACIERIKQEGLPVPIKSACFFCAASKTFEIDALEPMLLRRIVLLETHARPKLKTIDGLWRSPIKGMRGATPRPGSMVQYIRDKNLLPEKQIAAIEQKGSPALRAFQAAEASKALEERIPMREWVAFFDKNSAKLADGNHQRGFGFN